MASTAVFAGSAMTRMGARWRRHHLLAWSLRVAALVLPIAASFVLALAVSAALPRITDGATLLLWIVVIGTCTIGSLLVVDRAARRLLPLAALLDMSLAFPDRAPRRFAVARTRGRPSEIRDRLRAAVARHDVGEAENLLGVVQLVLALSLHDRATRGHSERVRVFTEMLAEELGLSEHERDRLRWAAVLHDIGKLEVPVSTLHKAGSPSAAEWAVIHRHPDEGAELVAPLLAWLEGFGDAVAQHHERWDGTGYPRGLKGAEISLAARIVALADTYEVMTAPRSYKRPMSVAAARKELTRVAGTQLDPALVRAFLNISVGRLWRTVGFGTWVAQFPLFTRFASLLSSWMSPSLAAAGAVVVVLWGAPGTVAGSAMASTVGIPAAAAPADPGTANGSGASVDNGGPESRGPGRMAPAAAATTSVHAGAPASTNGQGVGPAFADRAASRGSAAPSLCTTGCVANNDSACTSFCTGNHDVGCRTHCTGNYAVRCTTWCDGNHDVSCVAECIGNVPQAVAPPPKTLFATVRRP